MLGCHHADPTGSPPLPGSPSLLKSHPPRIFWAGVAVAWPPVPTPRPPPRCHGGWPGCGARRGGRLAGTQPHGVHRAQGALLFSLPRPRQWGRADPPLVCFGVPAASPALCAEARQGTDTSPPEPAGRGCPGALRDTLGLGTENCPQGCAVPRAGQGVASAVCHRCPSLGPAPGRWQTRRERPALPARQTGND